MAIRIGIMGYGNLGRGVELACAKNVDLNLCAIFTRREPSSVITYGKDVPVYPAAEFEVHADEIDVLIICGGSATDLPVQTPKFASLCNVVDSFDTHANIPIHFKNVDESARAAGKIGIISVGWDPGMFSLARLYGSCILPDGKDYTFWGRGVSQGHSDAVRRIDGVFDARQYTVPSEEALNAVRKGANPELTVRQKHKREVFVVAEEGADKEAITKQIVEMPNYFADYDTSVEFISADQMKRDHAGLPHGGSVIRTGKTGNSDSEHTQVIEYKLDLESNPEFTGSVLCACARAAYRMQSEGQAGCKTILDIPPVYLSAEPDNELRAHLL